MKRIIYFFLLFPFFLNAQEDLLLDYNDYRVDEPIISGTRDKSVLIVPFSSDLFQNQESKQIVEASDLSYPQTINYFKSSLDSALINALKDSCKVISMLTNFTMNTASDLEKIHGSAIYELIDRPIPVVESKKKNSLFKDRLKPSGTPSYAENSRNGDLVSVKEDNSNKFLSVKFDNEDLIHAMTMKYGVKYLLFITQFDLLADYSNPYQVAENRYERTIKVHYAIYNSNGKFVTGNFSTLGFPSHEDDIKAICTNYFPHIAGKIVKKLPY